MMTGPSSLNGSPEDLRRKLRAVAAVAEDSGAAPHERANARALKAQLEQRLKQAGAPAGDWSDRVFQLGKLAGEIRKSTAPGAPKDDWTDMVRRLGKALRRGYRKLSSER
jgi:hypothetical protein